MEWMGWVATAAFASSYFFEEQSSLRKVQAAAALLWVAYGAVIHSMPVIVANVVVAGVALWSTFAGPRRASLGSRVNTEKV
jgi:hypothetical protein